MPREPRLAPVIDDRKQDEINFHNQRERDRHLLGEKEFRKKYSNKKLYSINQKTNMVFVKWMRRNCQGKVVLDYCCGLGGTSLELAQHGAFVYGIDLSDEEVRTAEKTAAEAGYQDKTKFIVMDAEALDFEDSFFDSVVCNGVLHHLDVRRAFPELSRVLKPGGQIICIEALGYNPAINAYRKLTPHLRTAWEMKHILTMREVRKAESYFNRVTTRFFYLFSLLAVPFRNTPLFNPILWFLDGIDSIVLRIPFVQLMAWQMIFILSEPKK